MPFSFKVEGMDQLLSNFGKLPETAKKVAAEALYEGAGVMADAVGQAVRGIVTKRMKYPAPEGKQRMPSPEEKEILENARHGVAKFRNNGNEIDTSVGFQNSGYAVLKGRVVPVPVIANSINSGTSFMKKQPFMRKAFSQNKAKAIAAIENGIKAREDQFNID
jgi:HK97 gp10 family phage protein